MKDFFKTYKTEIIEGVIICVLILVCLLSIRTCSSYKKQNQINITALTDTIHTFNNKMGELVAYKTVMLADMKQLKEANRQLYDKIQNMNISGEVQQAIDFSGEADFGSKDTTWVIQEKEIQVVNNVESLNIKKEFDFSDQWHVLKGDVSLQNRSLSLNVDSNKVFFDYTTAVNDKNQVYITSKNPYVKYNSITGFTLPKQQKQKKIGIGPMIGYGLDVQHGKAAPFIGVGVSYNLFYIK